MTSTAFSPCPPPDYPARRARWLAAGALLALLAACGGGNTFTVEASGAATAQARAAAAPATDPAAALAHGAQLNAAELAAAEQQAQAVEKATGAGTPAAPLDMAQPSEIVAKSAYQSGAVARKAAAQRVTAYRFFNGQTAAHFFTTSETERAHAVATLPPFQFEALVYYVSKGFHFYTTSVVEKGNGLAKLPQYTYEGIGYYMLGDNWVPPAVSHAGITSGQYWEGKADGGGLRDKDNVKTNLGGGALGDPSGYLAAINQKQALRT